MKQITKIIIGISLSIIVIYYGIGYLSSYIGWYGYDKWKYRIATQTIGESVNRGVFVKELNFRIDSFSGNPFKFEAYIEKGFNYGHNTSRETFPLVGTNFPYQLSFNYKPSPTIGIVIRSDQIKKFDSSNGGWGYLKRPELPDTIILEIRGENIKSGLIKVW